MGDRKRTTYFDSFSRILREMGILIKAQGKLKLITQVVDLGSSKWLTGGDNRAFMIVKALRS